MLTDFQTCLSLRLNGKFFNEVNLRVPYLEKYLATFLLTLATGPIFCTPCITETNSQKEGCAGKVAKFNFSFRKSQFEKVELTSALSVIAWYRRHFRRRNHLDYKTSSQPLIFWPV